MEEESVEAVPSEDNGNVPVDAPSEQPLEETPVETPEESDQPAEPEELFELPDGRKVDGETLAKEWKDNFLPDYTRKSQALSKLEQENLPTNTEKAYQNPDWQPRDWKEAIEIAKAEALTEFETKEQQRAEEQQARIDMVNNELAEVKKVDPNLNENALFLHANKYGFRDLKSAYQNMKDMSEQAKKVANTTASNIAKRNDPVSVTPGATGSAPNPSAFNSALDYLRSIK